MSQVCLSSLPFRLASRPRSSGGVAVPTRHGGEVEGMLRELALVYRLTEQVKAAIRTEKRRRPCAA